MVKISRLALSGIIVAGGVAPAPALAQLISQQVEGRLRVCNYRMRAPVKVYERNVPVGAVQARTYRVGRGEPCPSAYPKYRETPPTPAAPAGEPLFGPIW